MKNIFLLVTVVLILTGCKKLDEKTQFDIDYTNTIIIQSSSPLNLPFEFETSDTETNSEEEFSIQNTNKEHIEEILLNETILTIKSPSGATFDFLKSIEIFINAEGLSEKKIAWKDNVSDNVGAQLELETTGDDLSEYIKKEEFKLRSRTITDKTVSQDIEVEVYTLYHVDAEVIGI